MLQKISIVGNSAAGKSTYCKKLGESLGIKVFTIDKIFWQAGWIKQDPSAFAKSHNAWLIHAAWIIDGIGYWNELNKRLDQSDRIIFIDTPVDICKQRALSRIHEEKSSPNPNVTKGCYYSDVSELQIQLIDDFNANTKPILLEILSNYEKGKVKILKNNTELGY